MEQDTKQPKGDPIRALLDVWDNWDRALGVGQIERCIKELRETLPEYREFIEREVRAELYEKVIQIIGKVHPAVEIIRAAFQAEKEAEVMPIGDVKNDYD